MKILLIGHVTFLSVIYLLIYRCMQLRERESVCVCVLVRACERERERERLVECFLRIKDLDWH